MRLIKITRKSENPSITRDVSGEGSTASIAEDIGRNRSERSTTGRKKSTHIKSLYKIDTTNILFICGGAFKVLENIAKVD